MDSFYNAPRQPPVRTTINKIDNIPVVPEVSVVDNSFYRPFTFNCPPRPQNPIHKPNFDNFHNGKHVRFEKPNFEKENFPQPLQTAPDLNGKTFKQIYMANVPDRHLDLSVFEPPRDEIREFSPRKFDKVLKNRECSPPKIDDVFKNAGHGAICCRTNEKNVETLEKPQEIVKTNDEPTIKDLYKIIQQQNEQIMLLQRQVNNLKSSIRQPESLPIQYERAQERPFMKEISNSPTKKGMISFDLKATSFEVSFRPQHCKVRKQNDFLEPKIHEIAECEDSKDTSEDISLHLEESLNLKDSYLSTEPTIDISMDEYHSSEEEQESVNIGLTFYQGLMGQVNNVLKKMQVQSECQPNKKKINNVTGQTMKAVKQATLQHLKSIGVNLTPIQEIHEVSGSDLENKNYDSSDVSFAVKQLLMKYLPDDKLTQAINKPKEQYGSFKEKKKYKPGNGEFSFATLQYLKKYNIIDNGRKFPETGQQNNDTPKILDVTALKLQPKLL